MIKKFEEYVYDIDRVFIKPLIMNDWSELDEHETEMLTKWLDQDHFLYGHWSFDPYQKPKHCRCDVLTTFLMGVADIPCLEARWYKCVEEK